MTFATALALLLQTTPDGCESAPPIPEPPPSTGELAPTPPYRTARHLEGYEDAYLGVGFLEASGGDNIYDRHQRISIPLYRDAGGERVGWIHEGWVSIGSSRRPLTYAGTTETGYELASLIMLDARDDGWIQIRYDEPRDGEPGTAWTHRCTLSFGTLSLEPRFWRDLFSGADAPPLYFRKRVSHALRAGPGVERERLAWIGPDDEVETLEIRGEWMRVRVSHPGKFLWSCISGGAWQGEERTGWIRWWDPLKGPWLYWPTRGC